MNIPPLVLYGEDNAMLNIIKSITDNEEALAAYAKAEAGRLRVLSNLLEKTGYSSNISEEASNIKNGAISTLQIAKSLQMCLNSSLDFLLEYYELQALRNIIPLSESYSCSISASGSGYISKDSDSFYPGTARLRLVTIELELGHLVEAKLSYTAKCYECHLELEAVSDELEVYWVELETNHFSRKDPHIVLITGQGIAKLSKDGDIRRKLVTFALTLWNCGRRKKEDKFRLTIYSPDSCDFIHDSGIVV